VSAARARATARQGRAAVVATDASALLGARLRDGALSARGLNKVTLVAQTVADLEGEDVVSFSHVSEALSLRAARAAVMA